MRILLVRHGESESNVDRNLHKRVADHAIELSARGVQQAFGAGQKVADYFKKNHNVSGCFRLWTSPYKRTRDTASCIQHMSSYWMRDKREYILLCEQQFGLFDGLSDDELKSQYPKAHAFYKKSEDSNGRFWARMPLGESRFDVATRVHQAFGTFQRDCDKHGIDNIVVVCHGTTLRAFVMMWCHLTPEWFDAEPNPDNCAIRLIEDDMDRGYL